MSVLFMFWPPLCRMMLFPMLANGLSLLLFRIHHTMYFLRSCIRNISRTMRPILYSQSLLPFISPDFDFVAGVEFVVPLQQFMYDVSLRFGFPIQPVVLINRPVDVLEPVSLYPKLKPFLLSHDIQTKR